MNRAECIQRIQKSFDLEEIKEEDRNKVMLVLSYIPVRTLRNICIMRAIREPDRATYGDIALTHGVSIDTVNRIAKKRL